MRFDRGTLALILAILLWDATGCSGAKKTDHHVVKLVPTTLHVRRPQGPGADPKAAPGGVDYTSQPLPNERFDCEKAEWLFREIDLKAARECLASLHQEEVEKAKLNAPVAAQAPAASPSPSASGAPVSTASPSPSPSPSGPPRVTRTVEYRLRREPAPFLYLDDPESAPECLRQTLSKIPVPREIFFQANSEFQPDPKRTRYDCYSARLDVMADQVIGLRLPKAKFAVDAGFPFPETPTDDESTRRILIAWVLTTYFQEKDLRLKSKIVPDAICRACMGEQQMLKMGDLAPLYWP